MKDTSNQLSRALTHMRSQGSEITNMRTIMADMTAQPLAPGGTWAAPAIEVKMQPACACMAQSAQTQMLISGGMPSLQAAKLGPPGLDDSDGCMTH